MIETPHQAQNSCLKVPVTETRWVNGMLKYEVTLETIAYIQLADMS